MSNQNQKINNRLKKVEGQAKAIKKMYKQGKDPVEIIRQINATKAALNKAASLMLQEELEDCYQGSSKEKLETILDNLFQCN